jgi:hypothetical protein
MEFVERIKEEILEVSQRRKNVTLEEILRIASRLEGLCTVKQRSTSHGVILQFNHLTIHVATHHPGSRQLKACYVDQFLDVMAELGLFDE